MNIFIKQILVGPMMNYAYIIGDPATKEVAIVDPGWEGERLIEIAEGEGYKVTAILATHTHFDHAKEVPVVARQTGCKIYVHPSEEAVFSELENVVPVGEGDRINIGNLEVDVIHTPGHTSGSICFITNGVIFTGDTLFIDAIGRTDLDGGDPEKMFASLQKLKSLPDSLIVYTGHHYGPSAVSTLGEQKKTNPYLKGSSVGDFLGIV